MKYAKITGAVRWSGGTTVLGAGMTADDHHPLVLERPDLFTDEHPGAQLSWPKPERAAEEPPLVERATRAPGEMRGPVKRQGKAQA